MRFMNGAINSLVIQEKDGLPVLIKFILSVS
jgi:hypothetical protein